MEDKSSALLHFPERQESLACRHDSDLKDVLIPRQPVPQGAEEFSKKVQGMLDGQPKDEATVATALSGMDAMLDIIAAKLYSMASMLVGEGEDSIRLVETAVARTEISAHGDATETRQNSRRVLCTAAVELIAKRDPEAWRLRRGWNMSPPALRTTTWSRREYRAQNSNTCSPGQTGRA